MQNLEFRDALATGLLLEPGLLDQKRAVELPDHRHPAVSLTEQPHKKWSSPVDLGQTDRQHLALLGFSLGDAPAQIHVYKFDMPLAAPPTQVGKHLAHEQIPLLSKVAERGTDKDANGTR